MLRYASESHARSSAADRAFVRVLIGIGEVVERQLRSQELSAECQQAAPDLDQRGRSRSRPIHRGQHVGLRTQPIDHTLQMTPQRDAKILLEPSPCFRRGEVVEIEPCRREPPSERLADRVACESPRSGQSHLCPGSAATCTLGGVPFAAASATCADAAPLPTSAAQSSFSPGGCSTVNLSVTPSVGSCAAARNLSASGLDEVGKRPHDPFLDPCDEHVRHDRLQLLRARRRRPSRAAGPDARCAGDVCAGPEESAASAGQRGG